MPKNIIAIGFGLAFAIFLAEGMLHLVADFLPLEVQLRTGHELSFGHKRGIRDFHRDWRQTFAPHPDNGYIYKPNLDLVLRGHPDFTYRLRTNAQGYRDELDVGDSQACAIALGDSFTYGWGVDAENAWPEILQTRWKCRVVNLGVSSYGSERILHSLEKTGWNYHPTLVIWAYFMNDPWDVSKFRAWRESKQPNMLEWDQMMKRARRREKQESPSQASWREFLHRHMISFALVKWTLKNWGYGQGQLQQVKYRDQYVDLIFHFKHLRKWIDVSDPRYIAGLHATKEALRKAKVEAASRSAALLVVLFPPKELVYWYLLSDLKLNITEPMLLRPYRDMINLCNDIEINCLNLTTKLRKRAQMGIQLYFRQDGHLNSIGNQVVAEEIQKIGTEFVIRQ